MAVTSWADFDPNGLNAGIKASATWKREERGRTLRQSQLVRSDGVKKKGAFGFEGAQFRGIAEPTTGVNLWRWRRIRDALVGYLSKTGVAK